MSEAFPVPDGPEQQANTEAHLARLDEQELAAARESLTAGLPSCPPHWVTNGTWRETGEKDADGNPIAVQVKACQACGTDVAYDYDPALDPANPGAATSPS